MAPTTPMVPTMAMTPKPLDTSPLLEAPTLGVRAEGGVSEGWPSWEVKIESGVHSDVTPDEFLQSLGWIPVPSTKWTPEH